MTDSPNDIATPANIEAETLVLGAVLINQEAFTEVAGFLKPDDFYLVKHRFIWEAFTAIQDAHDPIDTFTLRDHLERQNRFHDIGGLSYLTMLVANTPTAANVVAYARSVQETSVRRRLLNVASQIAKNAYDSGLDLNEVISRSEQSLYAVSEARTDRDLVHIGSVTGKLIEKIQQLYDQKGEPLGVPTGFSDLDKITGGLQRSDLVIIAGRPGQGKTALMLSVALNAAKYKKRVAFFSLEMPNEQLVQRLIAQETGIDTHTLRMGKLGHDDWSVLYRSVDMLSDLGIYLDDTPSISPMQLRTKARRLAAEVKLDMIVVDYLQLMTADIGGNANRVQEVSYISRNLKTLARELNVPVVAGAQLSRGVETRAGQKPMLSDLRESGSIEQDADVVMFLHHPDAWDDDPTRENITQILVAKHRNGPTGEVDLVFLSRSTKFVDAVMRTHDLNA